MSARDASDTDRTARLRTGLAAGAAATAVLDRGGRVHRPRHPQPAVPARALSAAEPRIAGSRRSHRRRRRARPGRRGVRDEFLGIPYAALPGRRAALAAAATRRALARRARRPRSFAAALPAAAGSSSAGPARQEDCLYLNVFTPATSKHGSHLPVMVWVHGGSLRTGEATTTTPPRWSARRRRGHHQLTGSAPSASWHARGAGQPPGRPVRRLRPDGPAGRAALGAAQHPRLRRRPAQRHHVRRIGGRPVHAVPAGLARARAGLFQRAIVESGTYQLTQQSLATRRGRRTGLRGQA